VLVERIVELLADVPAGTYVDATLGGAGHAAAVLDAHAGCASSGSTRTPTPSPPPPPAWPASAAGSPSATPLRRLAEAVAEHGGPVTAVLFDLGVSSPQLDRGERGFSHRFDAPLDMRMDTTSTGRTADDVVNRYAEADLARVLADLGDERYARGSPRPSSRPAR
jgi:16S rRNA (cytosine1402-N4)-methyltransferase